MRSAEERLDFRGGRREPKEVGGAADDVGEVIEGIDRITFVMQPNGYSKSQIHVSVLERQIEIDTPGFVLKRQIPRVDPRTAKTSFLNGVVSVTATRSGPAI